VADVGDKMLDHYRMLASLAGLIIVSKGNYSDTYAQTRRSREMALQAEMVWAFMAPRTFATERALVTAILEPAYEVGGDAFDYSLIGERLHVSLFDGVGHDLAAGLLTSVAMASCRSTRRSGGTLPDIVARAGQAIGEQFGDSRFGETRFVTALLCDLDIGTGVFSWIPCGHPPPLLIRGNKVTEELARRPELPLGIAEPAPAAHRGVRPGEAEPTVYAEQLEPGDRVLLYTDGVTEGRSDGGVPFGEQRLADFVIRHCQAGTPAPETLRRLNRAIIDYQDGRLSDDATTVMLEWMPDHPERRLAP
jgi:serine phosphatase RsbU (regulator of sigma subunit)